MAITPAYRDFLARLRVTLEADGTEINRGEAALIGYCVALAAAGAGLDLVPRCPCPGGSLPGSRAGKRRKVTKQTKGKA